MFGSVKTVIVLGLLCHSMCILRGGVRLAALFVAAGAMRWSTDASSPQQQELLALPFCRVEFRNLTTS
jgi:hypothetical protein